MIIFSSFKKKGNSATIRRYICVGAYVYKMRVKDGEVTTNLEMEEEQEERDM